MAVTHAACISARLRRLGRRYRSNWRGTNWSIAASVSVCGLGLLCVSGCGQSTAHSDGPTGVPQAVMPDWANPIAGVEVSITKAQRQVPFKITRIPTLANPYRVLITPGRPADARVVVLQYKTSYGVVDAYEELPEVSIRRFRAVTNYWVGLNGKKGTEGTVTAVQLAGGYFAALSTAANNTTSSIRWIEPGVEYMIMGPSLTNQDCVTLANLQASATRS